MRFFSGRLPHPPNPSAYPRVMSEVIISVRGEHEVRVAPEEAVVHLSVRTEGAVRSEVVARNAALTDPLRADLDRRLASGTVRRWASDRASVWSERPWHPEGARLDPVHHATVDVTAAFADFDALSGWVTEVADVDGVHLVGIQWLLGAETRVRLEEEAATTAVGVAVARARAYAGALGLFAVEAEHIADVGLLAESGDRTERRSAPLMAAAAFRDANAPSVQLRPEELVITAAIEARFRAH